MKFIGTYAISEDKWLPVLKKWVSMSPKERADAGEGVEIIGRWHDLAARTGVVIFRSDNLAAVQRYAGLWMRVDAGTKVLVIDNIVPAQDRSGDRAHAPGERRHPRRLRDGRRRV